MIKYFYPSAFVIPYCTTRYSLSCRILCAFGVLYEKIKKVSLRLIRLRVSDFIVSHPKFETLT